MHLPVTCRACGATFKVDAKYAGRRGRCPQPDCCGTYMVPEAAPTRSAAQAKSRVPKLSAVPRTAQRTAKPKRSPAKWWVVAGGTALVLTLAAVVVPWLPHSGSSNGRVMLLPSLASAQEQPATPKFDELALPFLRKHCVDCHGNEEPEAGISFASFTDERSMLKQRKLFERALDLVQQGVMPPADAEQPATSEKEPFLAYLNHALFFVDCSGDIDPGRVTIRRLNRAEYNNTVRDLVGVTFKPAADFPADDVGYGFDNIGDVLSLPPLLLEKYLDAAETVAKSALIAVDPDHPPTVAASNEELHLGPSAQVGENGVSINSEGFVAMDFEAPLEAEYLVRLNAGGQRGGNELPKMELRVDDKRVHVFDVKARDRSPEDHERRVNLTRGRHRIAAAFINDFYDPRKRQDRNLMVRQIAVVGPVAIDPSHVSDFQQTYLAQHPSAEVTVNFAVRNNLRPFLKRAFRRHVNESELDQYVEFVNAEMEQGSSFDLAMQTTLTAILVSPHFLYRVETDRNPDDPSDTHPLNDFELASRLSYFLWSSMPDERLFALAEQNELHRDEILEAEIRRMLGDPKSQALVDNFAEQWLQLRILNDLRPDPERFPEFGPDLRADMQQETKRLFAHIHQEDRSLLEFLDARYTFLNERLAKHYGIAGVTGNEFREVSLEGTTRSGVLTHASIMTMTSNPNRTSPVKRGKWIMEVILNKPPPPPPPNVPELESAKAGEGLTFRQQLELHRQNASCASCHRVMDELGFGLENYDPIGRFRESDGNTPLDVSGELPDGAKFSGSQELAGVLRQKQTEFAKCLADKLLTYALGRGLEYYDRCTVNHIAETSQQQDFKFSALVTAVVKSEAFRMRRGEEVTETNTIQRDQR